MNRREVIKNAFEQAGFQLLDAAFSRGVLKFKSPSEARGVRPITEKIIPIGEPATERVYCRAGLLCESEANLQINKRLDGFYQLDRFYQLDMEYIDSERKGWG